MAGGEGTRLRPLTLSQPKPMLPVANRPLMEHVVDLLRVHGFDDITVTVAYRGEALRSHFGTGAELGVRLRWVTEADPLGTAGSIRAAVAGADEALLVISGDVITDIDLSAVIAFHHRRGAECTVALQQRPDPLDFGMAVVGEDGAVERFVEKPSRGQVLGDAVNTGIYVLEPGIVERIPRDRPVDFSGEVFPQLLADGRAVFGYRADGYWEDVGTLDSYRRVHRDLLARRVGLAVPGFALADGIWLGEGADVDPRAKIAGPAIVGAHCRVEAGAELGPDTVLGSNVRVGPDVSIEGSIVHDNVYLGPGVHLRGSVVGRRSRVHRGARLDDGSVLGEDCIVGENAVVGPGVAVYPSKTVDAGAVVDSSIIWESRGARSLFGRLGVAGLANVDITPETVVRLAMAFATTMPRRSRVVVSRDTSRVGRLLMGAVTVGLNAAGVDVVDLEVATVPMTRFAVRHERRDGGVTVRLVPGDPNSVILRLLDAEGVDVGDDVKKRIQRIFEGRDARHSLAGEIGEAVSPGLVAEEYTAAVTELIDVAAVRAARPKVVLDYSYGAASFVMPNVLAKLGADVLAVNPYASTPQALGFDRFAHAREVARLVQASGAELGAVIDSDGVHITFVDDRGHVLSDDEGLFVLLGLVLDDRPAAGPATDRAATDRAATDRAATDRGGTDRPRPGIALPVSVGMAVEARCRRAGADLVLTGTSGGAVLTGAGRAGIVFGASRSGAYVFPRFLVAFDAVATLVSAIGLLTGGDRRLSELVALVPPTVVRRVTVPVPWDRTGAVMRTVLHDDHAGEVVLVDGIKVLHDDGWVLVVADPEVPAVNVTAEAASADIATDRAEDYAGRVRRALGLVGSPSPAGVDSSMFSA